MGISVVGARFLLTSGHFVATCLASASLETSNRVNAASIVAYLSFVFAGSSLFAGWDIFSPSKNAIHVFCHFLGGVMVCRMILHDLEPSRYLWYVVLLAHLPSSVCTLDATSQLFTFKTSRQPYNR